MTIPARSFWLCLALLAACQSTPARTDEKWRQAESASARGDWLAAGELWHRIWVEDQGQDPRVGWEFARALYRQGDNSGAGKVIEASLEKDPLHADLQELYAEVLLALGHSSQARAVYERLLQGEPERARAWQELGELCLQDGDARGAIAALEQAARLAPHEKGIFLSIAQAGVAAGDDAAELHALARAIQNGEESVPRLLRAGRLGAERALSGVDPNFAVLASEWLERAVALDPQRAEAHYWLGRLARLRLDLDSATVHLRRAVELDPTDPLSIVELAEVYNELREPAETIEFVRRGLELQPEPSLRERLERLELPGEQMPEVEAPPTSSS